MRRAFGLFAIVMMIFSSCSEQSTHVVVSQEQSEKKTTNRYAVPVGQSFFSGPANAPITIIDFSDFQCPFSGRAVSVIEQLMKEYPQKIRHVYKYFPLAFHRIAKPAARAAVAAGNQGKFWEFYHAIYHRNDRLSRKMLEETAKKIGLDMERYKQDVASDATQAVVDADIALGHRFGVRGTPTLFVNGRRVVGARVDVLKRIIEDDLHRLSSMNVSTKEGFYAAFIKNGRTHFVKPPSPAPIVSQTIYRVLPPASVVSEGDKSAPVRAVFFMDYQCPYSRKVYETLKTIVAHKQNNFLRQFVMLPLSFHSHARRAAMAALVAANHHLFIPFSDKLFSTTHVWQNFSKEDFDDYLKAIVVSLGVDEKQYEKEMRAKSTFVHLKEHEKFARSLGIHITPAVFINGRYIRGAYPISSFESVFAEEQQRAQLKRQSHQKLSPEELYVSLVENGRFSVNRDRKKKIDFDDAERVYSVRLNGDEILFGNRKTPIELILFFDFQCPYSKRLFSYVKELLAARSEQVHVVLKHFPMGYHPFARDFALYSAAVSVIYDKKKAAALVPVLFAAQHKMKFPKTADELLQRISEKQGVDWKRVKAEMAAPTVRLMIDKDMDEANRLGLKGVPTLFISGKKVDGLRSLDFFEKLIDKRQEELERHKEDSQ